MILRQFSTRISTRWTTFMHCLGGFFLAIPLCMATTPTMSMGHGVMRHAASPTERWEMVFLMIPISLFISWQILILYHVHRGQRSFLCSRFGQQTEIHFQDVVCIDISKLSFWRGSKTAYIQYRDREGRFRSVSFLVALGVVERRLWLENLRKTIFSK